MKKGYPTVEEMQQSVINQEKKRAAHIARIIDENDPQTRVGKITELVHENGMLRWERDRFRETAEKYKKQAWDNQQKIDERI